MSNWPISFTSRRQTIGENIGDGTTISCPNGSKGAYVVLGTTEFACRGFYLSIVLASSLGFRFDLAIGAADTVIVPDMLIDGRPSGVNQNGPTIWIPLAIPAGVEVKIRGQATGGSASIRALVTFVQAEWQAPEPSARLIALNALSGTDSTAQVTTNATAGVSTAYVEVSASCPEDVTAVYLTVTSAGDTGRTASRLLIDVATGPAGSEVVRLTYMATNGPNAYGGIQGPFPLAVSAGTRIAYRVRQATTAADVVALAVHGLT